MFGFLKVIFMNNLLKRTISGIIFVFIMVEGTLWTSTSFLLLWTIIGMLSLYEYFRLIKKSQTLRNNNIAYIGGALYIIIPILLVMTMDPRMVVTFLTVVWLNDVGAYIIGSAIGKHRMAPKISPKKSWEGFFGGLLFAIVAALVWYLLLWSDPQRSIAPLFQDTNIQISLWLLFGLAVGIAAVLGDLIESKLKRVIGVKDSGNLIPGHGGMLDRFDATLLAAPVAWIFYKFILFV